jgi:hypothetical protein
MLLMSASALAALPIDLEVAAEGDAPFGAIQEWNKVLATMDLARVRLRGAHGGDTPKLEVHELGGVTRYVLVGLLNRRDELVLPGGRFHQSDRAGLKQYFEELPERHSVAKNAGAPFGLSVEQYTHVLDELARPVEEPTLDGSPHELLAVLTKDVPFPVEGDLAMRALLRDAEPFRAQMKGLSVGTTLAAMLRGAGLQFAPDTLGRAPVTLRVVPLDPTVESWPVGWKPPLGPRQIAPAMYEFRNIEIGNFTLAATLTALQPFMSVPIVVDQRVVAARGIDLEKVAVKFPRQKTYVRRALDYALSQGRLSGELRIDEAGKPFYWATQFGKDSPRAREVDRAGAED